MKKRYILSTVGAAGVTAAGYFLKDRQNRDRVIQKINDVKEKVISYNNETNSTFENAGVPDQSENKELSQLENAKMVSEGSQFGVQYYNEEKNENTSDNQQQ
ncbi:hypothetical protein [Virgibacillus ainsalahensis]